MDKVRKVHVISGKHGGVRGGHRESGLNGLILATLSGVNKLVVQRTSELRENHI